MKSKFKIYDKLRDMVTGYIGTVTCIQFNGERFSYALSTEVDVKQSFLTTEFNESRLELAPDPKNIMGFLFMETELT